MSDDNKGDSGSAKITREDAEQPGERVNDITPTNTPEPVPDPSRKDTENESDEATEQRQGGGPHTATNRH